MILYFADNEVPEGIGSTVLKSMAEAISRFVERIRLEDAMRRSEARFEIANETFQLLVENSPFGIYTVDADFRVAQMNINTQNGAFKNVRPAIGADFSQAMHTLWSPDVAKEVVSHFRKTLDTGEPYYSPRFTNTRHDIGVAESYEWELHRIRLPDGRWGVVCYYYDSTALRKAQESLQLSEERLRLAVEVGQLGTWDWNLLSDEIVWSDEHYRLQGYEPGEVEASFEAWVSRVHPDDRDHVLAAVQTAKAQKRDYVQEYRVRFPDGVVRWCAARGRFYYDRDGKAVRMLGHIRDITAQKNSQEQLILLLREVNHRSKNLLAQVQAIAMLTAKGNPSDFAAKFSERLQGLSAAQDLLVKSGWKEVSIRAIFLSQLSGISDLIGTRVRLQGPELELAAGAVQSMAMAAHELATNAMKYGALSNNSGGVDVAWSVVEQEAGPVLKISWVEHGGPKVSPPGRTGFGTRVLRNVVQDALDATVQMDYRPEGLSWSLECQARNALSSDVQRVGKSEIRSAEPAALGKTVLIVEDEPLIALELKEILSDSGYAVWGPANSVASATALLTESDPDCAVLDVHLGGETSEAVAQRLQAAGTPFVILSGYSTEQLPSAYRGAPSLSKPLEPRQLLAELRKMLEARTYARS